MLISLQITGFRLGSFSFVGSSRSSNGGAEAVGIMSNSQRCNATLSITIWENGPVPASRKNMTDTTDETPLLELLK